MPSALLHLILIITLGIVPILEMRIWGSERGSNLLEVIQVWSPSCEWQNWSIWLQNLWSNHYPTTGPCTRTNTQLLSISCPDEDWSVANHPPLTKGKGNPSWAQGEKRAAYGAEGKLKQSRVKQTDNPPKDQSPGPVEELNCGAEIDMVNLKPLC